MAFCLEMKTLILVIEETTRDNPGNRGRETNSVKVVVKTYLNERRMELSVLKVYIYTLLGVSLDLQSVLFTLLP